jgi:ubiquinone/menaquinone biosynthesis C-methylase UbiE
MDWVGRFFDDPFFARDFETMKEETERTAREVEFIIRELHLGSEDRVLDLACGFGRHTLAIAPRVKAITGTDRTASFIETAQADAKSAGIANAEFHTADMRELDYHAEFDAIYNYFTAWGYYDDETNFDVLKRIYRALKPGGRFLMEFIHRDAEMRHFRSRSWRRPQPGVVVLQEERFDFSTGRLYANHVFIEGGDVREIEIDHHLPSSDEFVRLFKRAGFSTVRLVSAPDGGELTLNTRRLAVIGAV